MARALALVLACTSTAACTVPIVPTERMPIDWVRHGTHGNYEKGGVPLSGETCGEQYQRAVTGVPEAERLMRECESANDGYGLGMLGFVTAPALGAAAGELFDHGLGRPFQVGAAIGVVSFLVGVGFALHASEKRSAAVHAYNAALR